LQTIVWKYDSFDWRVGLNNITVADVDNNYGLFINNLTTGTFNTLGGIMLTHELNNFTMQEAIKWYPQLEVVIFGTAHSLVTSGHIGLFFFCASTWSR
jgi:hypothetical protein